MYRNPENCLVEIAQLEELHSTFPMNVLLVWWCQSGYVSSHQLGEEKMQREKHNDNHEKTHSAIGQWGFHSRYIMIFICTDENATGAMQNALLCKGRLFCCASLCGPARAVPPPYHSLPLAGVCRDAANADVLIANHRSNFCWWMCSPRHNQWLISPGRTVTQCSLSHEQRNAQQVTSMLLTSSQLLLPIS